MMYTNLPFHNLAISAKSKGSALIPSTIPSLSRELTTRPFGRINDIPPSEAVLPREASLRRSAASKTSQAKYLHSRREGNVRSEGRGVHGEPVPVRVIIARSQLRMKNISVIRRENIVGGMVTREMRTLYLWEGPSGEPSGKTVAQMESLTPCRDDKGLK